MKTLSPLNFSVKTKVFEGPLELLLDLVEKRKLLINDISLATVTNDYLEQVHQAEELSLPNISQFVSLASTLLLVKSKSLLPVLTLTEEEEVSIADLESRLKKYQVFRDAGLILQENFGKKILYQAQYSKPQTPIFLPDEFCTLENLHEAMLSSLKSLPEIEPKAKAKIKAVISLGDMIKKLERKIALSSHLKFSELRDQNDKKTTIVGFLAVLELFRQGNLIITQVRQFSEIEIELENSQTPTYY